MFNIKDSTDKSGTNKFDVLANDWWDTDGPLRTLHDINAVRLGYIIQRIKLSGKTVADVGCGAGILAEAMSASNASVTGIDISASLIAAANEHARGHGLTITYATSGPEEFAATHPHQFDVVTCMEMLEHVPDPAAVVSACAEMLKPGGHVFFSTINRTVKAYLFAVLGAEYVLKLLPAGTHEYASFIRPSELAAWCQRNSLVINDISGMSYSPVTRRASLIPSPDVNYLLHASLQDLRDS
jgi:2-polyprenyl-6-hydroxyphenyl methylase/3-demethylubiquinone-9 3-methyltransferase